jgi:hypothetical protein
MSDFKLLGTEMTMKANGNVGPFIMKVGKIWKIVVKWQVINCSAISWQKQPTFQWNDDECLLWTRPTKLDFYTANSLKQ